MNSPELHRNHQSEELRPCRLTSSAAASARATTRRSRTVSASAASGRSNPSTTGTSSRAVVSRERDRGRARTRSGATPTCCPATPPPDAASGPGLHAARPGAAARERARDRRGAAEARPREPDPLVQGPRRRRRGGEGAASSGSRRSRAPRPATSRTPSPPARPRAGCRAVIFCPAGLEPEKLSRRRSTARAIYARSRQLRRLLAGWSASSRARSTGGSSTSTCAPTTPRARRRSRSRSSSSSAGRRRRGRRAPIASGAMFTKLWQGFEQFGRLGLIAGERPQLFGGQAEGCAPVADGVRRRAARLAGAAELDRPLARDRQPRRRRPRDRDRARVGRRDLRRPGGRGRRRTWRCSPRRPASSARRRAGRRRSARCARRSPRGELGEPDRVVVLVTRHRPEDAAGGRVRDERRADRDRARPRCAARRARGDCVTDAIARRGARGRSTRVDRELLAPVNRRLELVRALHEHKLANGHAAARPRPRGVDGREPRRRRTAGRSRPTGSPSSSGYVLELTRRELHGGLGRIVCLPGDGIGPEVMRRGACACSRRSRSSSSSTSTPSAAPRSTPDGDPLPPETLAACRAAPTRSCSARSAARGGTAARRARRPG